MLFYQPSRGVADVVSDTFAWLTANRRVLVALLLCMIPVILATEGVFNLETLSWLNDSRLESIVASFKPFALYTSWKGGSDTLSILGYVVLTSVTTFIMLPLIREYFYYRRAVRNLSFRAYLRLLGKEAVSMLWIALLLGVGVWLGLKVSRWFTLMMLMIISYFWPAYLMKLRLRRIDIDCFYKFILGQPLLLFIMCVVQDLPRFCIILFKMALYYFDELVPGVIGSGVMDEWISSGYVIIMEVMYVMSMIVYLTGSVLLYGRIIIEDEEE